MEGEIKRKTKIDAFGLDDDRRFGKLKKRSNNERSARGSRTFETVWEAENWTKKRQ